jgi:hypothetical protein
VPRPSHYYFGGLSSTGVFADQDNVAVISLFRSVPLGSRAMDDVRGLIDLCCFE